jgi:4,5-dihydroxyphthalate decarboxylase
VQWVTAAPVCTGIELPAQVRISHIDSGQNLERMLEAGEIDALASVVMPKSLFAEKAVIKRLFPNYREVESDYYRRTHIFPIMHTLVLKTEVFHREPWVAISLYKAFVEAKDLNYKRLYDSNALVASLPWLIDDIESARRVFGPEIWDYSIEGSRPTLEAFLHYLDEQKLTRRRITIEELFAPNISPEFLRYLRGTGEA